MIEIIDWLIKVERLASDLYFEASEYFEQEEALAAFLKDAAEDEAWHYHIMGSAKSQINEVTIPKTAIELTENMKHKIETPFQSAFDSLKSRSLSVEQMLDCIIETEYSEWNKIFLYVVNSLKNQIRQFYYPAARIQHHMGRIQHFLLSMPYSARRVNELEILDKVFDENILVVEDNEIIADFLASFLEDEGNVDVTYNGQEALDKMQEKYYKLIIADNRMPVMSGMELYEKAVSVFPNMKDRFLFMSSDRSDMFLSFIKKYNIPYLPKPSPIEDISRYAKQVIYEANRTQSTS